MSTAPSPLALWQQFHWAFFVNTQGLIIALGRFKATVERGDLTAAKIELNTASDLLRASGASMELAGSFIREGYDSEVRTSMMQPNVSVDNFSGLMSWDHASLIQLWKTLRPTFQNLPGELQVEHDDFLKAYGILATSHRAVCEKFGGGEGGSIRNTSELAVNVLDRFDRRRRTAIEPNPKLKSGGGCPFHP